jgi:hypothetical protein
MRGILGTDPVLLWYITWSQAVNDVQEQQRRWIEANRKVVSMLCLDIPEHLQSLLPKIKANLALVGWNITLPYGCPSANLLHCFEDCYLNGRVIDTVMKIMDLAWEKLPHLAHVKYGTLDLHDAFMQNEEWENYESSRKLSHVRKLGESIQAKQICKLIMPMNPRKCHYSTYKLDFNQSTIHHADPAKWAPQEYELMWIHRWLAHLGQDSFKQGQPLPCAVQDNSFLCGVLALLVAEQEHFEAPFWFSHNKDLLHMQYALMIMTSSSILVPKPHFGAESPANLGKEQSQGGSCSASNTAVISGDSSMLVLSDDNELDTALDAQSSGKAGAHLGSESSPCSACTVKLANQPCQRVDKTVPKDVQMSGQGLFQFFAKKKDTPEAKQQEKARRARETEEWQKFAEKLNHSAQQEAQHKQDHKRELARLQKQKERATKKCLRESASASDLGPVSRLFPLVLYPSNSHCLTQATLTKTLSSDVAPNVIDSVIDIAATSRPYRQFHKDLRKDRDLHGRKRKHKLKPVQNVNWAVPHLSPFFFLAAQKTGLRLCAAHIGGWLCKHHPDLFSELTDRQVWRYIDYPKNGGDPQWSKEWLDCTKKGYRPGGVST